MSCFKSGALLSLSFVALACGGETSGAPFPGKGDQDLGSESQDELRQRGDKIYDCGGQDIEGSLGRFELVLSGSTKAKITSVSKSAAAPGTGTLDPDYNPTSASYQGASLFNGFDTVRDSMSASDFGSLSLIVSKALKDGGDNKRVWIRYNGGGSTTEGYTCKKKSKLLAVDVDRPSRVTCDLKMVCDNDNPPGDTCLSELFIKQTGEQASLRATYYDHFGVRAEKRHESRGNAALSRTSDKISASWDGFKVNLKYRAGVTYMAKVTLPDGRTTEGQCSDLAMLDD